mmetsp:Transcript_13968/g.37986  ORF Transcript_13968/g.37986 Transcript_13968/m.37986 type:complete len:397 (-) Transcript_13968:5-1195(-)
MLLWTNHDQVLLSVEDAVCRRSNGNLPVRTCHADADGMLESPAHFAKRLVAQSIRQVGNVEVRTRRVGTQRSETIPNHRLCGHVAQDAGDRAPSVDPLAVRHNVLKDWCHFCRPSFSNNLAADLLWQSSKSDHGADDLQVGLVHATATLEDQDLCSRARTDPHQVVNIIRASTSRDDVTDDVTPAGKMVAYVLLHLDFIPLGEHNDFPMPAAANVLLDELLQQKQCFCSPTENQHVPGEHNPEALLLPIVEATVHHVDDEAEEGELEKLPNNAQSDDCRLHMQGLCREEARLRARIDEETPRGPETVVQRRVVVLIAAEGLPRERPHGDEQERSPQEERPLTLPGAQQPIDLANLSTAQGAESMVCQEPVACRVHNTCLVRHVHRRRTAQHWLGKG